MSDIGVSLNFDFYTFFARLGSNLELGRYFSFWSLQRILQDGVELTNFRLEPDISLDFRARFGADQVAMLS